jgi:hypothetical protein
MFDEDDVIVTVSYAIIVLQKRQAVKDKFLQPLNASLADFV